MRVMIMAAGIGTRLRPLTDLVPKPMAPIVNRPALYHILRLLSRHGFREVIINLHHLPEAITGYFGDGNGMGMEIRYSFEPDLLGTAGGVRNNASFLESGTFLVVSGDALTDIDLTGLVAAHRRYGSIATLAVKEVADPSLYGVVVTDDEDRVVGFQEKPSLEEARSRLCNCGIYVFEPEILAHILPSGFDDFGRRVFPDLLRHGIRFQAHAVGGYWSDVGNLHEYIKGNGDALAGRVDVEIPGQEVRPGLWMEEGVTVASSARMEPPVAIGEGSLIGEDAVVEGPCVIGDGCIVGAGAHIVRTLVLRRAHISPGAVVVDGIIGQRTGRFDNEPQGLV
ncbi:MAG: NDP-sugar synthase [Actinomycetia bacterium]|nr:NDP-sugar synthase [Actinomycetes bacterium]